MKELLYVIQATQQELGPTPYKMVTLDRPASMRDILDFSKSHIDASIC